MRKSESIEDTARVMSRFVDAIVIRTFAQKDVDDLAANASVPVINALTDEDHPCQALADIFTFRETFRRLPRGARSPTWATATTWPLRWPRRAPWPASTCA